MAPPSKLPDVSLDAVLPQVLNHRPTLEAFPMLKEMAAKVKAPVKGCSSCQARRHNTLAMAKARDFVLSLSADNARRFKESLKLQPSQRLVTFIHTGQRLVRMEI